MTITVRSDGILEKNREIICAITESVQLYTNC